MELASKTVGKSPRSLTGPAARVPGHFEERLDRDYHNLQMSRAICCAMHSTPAALNGTACKERSCSPISADPHWLARSSTDGQRGSLGARELTPTAEWRCVRLCSAISFTVGSFTRSGAMSGISRLLRFPRTRPCVRRHGCPHLRGEHRRSDLCSLQHTARLDWYLTSISTQALLVPGSKYEASTHPRTL